MANLETLELTINANAEGASKGISRLIDSLSALSDAIVKPFSDLVDLNAEIAKLKNIRNIKIPNLSATTNARGVAKGAASAAPVFRSGERKPITVTNNLGANSMMSEAERMAAHPEWYRSREDFEEIVRQQQAKFAAAQAAKSSAATPVSSAASSVVDAANANTSLSTSAKEVEKSMDSASTAIKANAHATEESAASATRAAGSFSKLVSQVGRIAKLMIIRQAIKAMIKGFSEAWNNAYEFSKRMGGTFAKTMDQTKLGIQNIATNIVRAFAPLMSAVLPVIITIANGVQFLSNCIIQLLKLLGMTSELFGATADSIAAAGGASGKAARDVLAGFDELNTLDTGSGGGGSSGGGLSGIFNSEINAMTQLLVGEALLAAGLVLAFCGHVGVGLALAAVGAAAIAGVVVEKWGQLSEDVKGEITKIMAVIGISLLAVGAIMAFAVPGLRGMGIALMAAGAANLAASVILSWSLSADIKKEVGKILGVLGGALLVVGAILALTGVAIPLGVALMAAGGVSLRAAVALNWDGLAGKIKTVFGGIKDRLVEIWGNVKTAVTDAWNSVVEWASAKWSAFSRAWDDIKDKFDRIWGKIKEFAVNAWEGIKSWWGATWETFGSGWSAIKRKFQDIWNGIMGFATEAWAGIKSWTGAKWENFKQGWDDIKRRFRTTWSNILSFAGDAWNGLKKWWAESKWGSTFESAWNGIKEGFSGVWTEVQGSVSTAWEDVKTWIETTWSKFRNWDTIKSNMLSLWGNIQTKVNDAWRKVSQWINAKWTDMSKGWDEIRSGFGVVWGNIGNAVNNAWSNVKTWIESTWNKHFKSTWDNIESNLSKAWENIKTAVGNAHNKLKEWWQVSWNSLFKTPWETVEKNLKNVWIGIMSAVSNAWNKVKQWWDGSMVADIEKAWTGIKGWFEKNVTTPIADAFNGALDTIKSWINVIIGALNKLGHVQFKGYKDPIFGVTLIPAFDIQLWDIKPLTLSTEANGELGIPKGQLFIANEAGAELVGTMDGKTTVANQEQIIEGIRRGVRDANSEQNDLLRRQNELLWDIYQKDNTVRFGASSALGRIAKQSISMYESAMGV